MEQHSSDFLRELERSSIEEEEESMRSSLSLESDAFDIYEDFNENASSKEQLYDLPKLNEIN